MRRFHIALLLVAALLLGPLAPAMAYWSCADGTPCAVIRVAGAGIEYQRPADPKGGTCCVISRPVACRHGVGPATGSPRTSLDAPDHCFFTVHAAASQAELRKSALLTQLLQVEPSLFSPTVRFAFADAEPLTAPRTSPSLRPSCPRPAGPARAPPASR